MVKSLQEQLLKAGLANKKQAVRAKKAKNNKEKLKRAGKDVSDEVAQAVQQADLKKATKDRELNEEKNKQAQQAAIQAQIVQLIEMNAVGEGGDIEFNFPEGKIIKTINVTSEQRTALLNGALAIVRLRGKATLVPRKTAEKITQRDDSIVLLCNTDTGDHTDDEYAEFKVPDYLMW